MEHFFKGKMIVILILLFISIDICHAKTIDVSNLSKYGIIGDGVKDDTSAIQQLFNDVSDGDIVNFGDKHFRVSSQINISNKQNITVSGGYFYVVPGTAYKEIVQTYNTYLKRNVPICKQENGRQYQGYSVFYITNNTNCTFKDMNFKSDLSVPTCTTAENHYRRNGKSSNARAFSGNTNDYIYFLNNTFDSMDDDYWLQSQDDSYSKSWKNIVIDGWESTNSIMSLFGRYLQNIVIKNANVVLSPTYADEGDHHIYIEEKSKNILIKDSTFTYNNSEFGVYPLTFHKGTGTYDNDALKDLQPTAIRLEGVKIESDNGYAIWSASSEPVYIYNSEIITKKISPDTNSQAYCVLCGGTSKYHVFDSIITSGDTIIKDNLELYLDNTTVHSVFFSKNSAAYRSNILVNNSTIEFSQVLDFSQNNQEIYHKYKDSKLKNIGNNLTYIFSKRASSGKIIFDNTEIDGKSSMLVYNGGSQNMNGFIFKNTTINNVGSLGNNTEAKNYQSCNSTINGTLISNNNCTLTTNINNYEEKIYLDAHYLKKHIGETYDFSYKTVTENSVSNVTYSVSNSSVGTINNGHFTAKNTGTVYVTVTWNNHTDTCRIDVLENDGQVEENEFEIEYINRSKNLYLSNNINYLRNIDSFSYRNLFDGVFNIIGNYTSKLRTTELTEKKSDNLCTGDHVTIIDSNTNNEYDYIISILGDYNGDGKKDIDDLTAGYKRLKDTESSNMVRNEYDMALDLKNDGYIKINDIAKLYREIK